MLPVSDNERLGLPEDEVSDISFASAEARYALLCARRLRLVMHVVGMVLVFALSLVAALVIHSRRQADGGVMGAIMGQPQQPVSLGIDPVGSPDAKVQVLAILPADSDCHSGVAKLLSDVATARPEEFYVEFKALGEMDRGELDRLVGQVCAAIVVNDKTSFTLEKDGRTKQVSLIGTEPTNYRLGDVGEILAQVHAGIYGDPGEPIYHLQPSATCDTGCTTAGHDHGHGHEQAEPREPIEVILPGRLPAIQGLD